MSGETYHVDCNCGCAEHAMRFKLNVEDKLIYVETFLNQYYPWHRRLWIALKYVFGHKSRYGHFDETVLDTAQVRQLQNLIDMFNQVTGIKTDVERSNERMRRIIKLVSTKDFDTYCLGVGCMSKCRTCHHEKNWALMEELDNADRSAMQANMARVDQTKCQITSGCFYREV